MSRSRKKGKYRYKADIVYYITPTESIKKRLEFVANNDLHAKQEAIRMCNAYKKLIDFNIIESVRVEEAALDAPYNRHKPVKPNKYTVGRTFGFTQPSRPKPEYSFHYGETE